MQKLKNEKGITLIVLVITIIVLFLISATVIINTKNVVQFNNYSKFKDDIDKLRESISIAFFDRGIEAIGPKYTIPTDFLDKTQNGKPVRNPNDNENYYVINVNIVNNKLSTNMTELNNGTGNKSFSGDEISEYKGPNDVYIINEQSRTIYYVKGIEYNGETFYRLPEELSEVDA